MADRLPANPPHKRPFLSRFLRYLRKERGWTQRLTASKVGVGRETYQQWELGNVRPSLGNTRQLAHALSVPPALLELLIIWPSLPEERQASLGAIIHGEFRAFHLRQQGFNVHTQRELDEREGRVSRRELLREIAGPREEGE